MEVSRTFASRSRTLPTSPRRRTPRAGAQDAAHSPCLIEELRAEDAPNQSVEMKSLRPSSRRNGSTDGEHAQRRRVQAGEEGHGEEPAGAS